MSIEKESELEREPTREECVAIAETWLAKEPCADFEFARRVYVADIKRVLAHLRAPALVLSEVQIDAVERSVECLARYAESIEQGPGGKHRDLQAITADVRARMSILRAIASRGKL